MELVRDGKAVASIVVPDKALASERFAAQELQDTLRAMSGAELPIVLDSERPSGSVVTVGATADVPASLVRELAVEECVIRTFGSARLMIVGGRLPPLTSADGHVWVRDRGTLYGVYEFLTRLGVRWFDPSPLGTVIPRRSTIETGEVRYRHKPSFPYRGGYRGLWAVRNRYNGNVWGGPEWGGIWYEWLAHMYYYVIPPKRFFEKHPEWFPLIGGKRVKEGQLCTTQPEVVERFVRFVLDTYKRNPQLKVLGIEANDGHGWCECDACKALDNPKLLTPYKQISMSPRVMDFNVRIARRVAAKNPKAMVGWYIYNDHTEFPPGLTKLPENLHGRFCTYASAYSDYSQSIETGTSAANLRTRAALEAWRGVLTHMSTYEYWSGYTWFGPMPIRPAIAANLRYYHRLGLEGCYQLGPQHWGSQGFNYWMAGRLLWDSTLDEDALLADYCHSFFGPAGDAVKALHLRLERAVAESGRPVMSGGAYIEPIFTEAVMKDGFEILSRAFAAADTPVIRLRLERVRDSLRFADKAARMDRLEKAGKLDEALAVGRDLLVWLGELHPSKEAMRSGLENRCKAITDAGDKGDVADAARQSRELAKWLDTIDRGRFIFAGLDSEPGRHLQDRVKKLAAAVKDFARLRSVADVVCKVPSKWHFHTDPGNVGRSRGWYKVDADAGDWPMIPIASWWENAGYPGYDGRAWYRTSLSIPEAFQGRSIRVFFGAVDGDATVYLNGRKMGEHLLGKDGAGWDQAFSVDVTDAVRFGRDNILVVEVFSDVAYGGIWKSVRVISPRPGSTSQGNIRFPLERDKHTVLLLDFQAPVKGWMACEAYAEGAFPGQGDANRAAAFAHPDQKMQGLRLGVTLPEEGTIECWVKPDGLQRKHATLCTIGSVGNTKLSLYLGADNRVRGSIVRQGGKSETLTSSVSLPDRQWTHVALSWGRTIPIRLMINGQVDQEGRLVGPPYQTGSDILYVGCQPWWVKEGKDHTAWYLDLNFRGCIDDLRISDVVRTNFAALGL